MNKTNEMIGKILRALRKKAGLSLRDLQDKIGVSYNTLGTYERGYAQPTLENCYKVCKFFQVPIEYLMLGEDCIREFSDLELKTLFSKVNELDPENRKRIKQFIMKFVEVKAEFDKLVKETE